MTGRTSAWVPKPAPAGRRPPHPERPAAPVRPRTGQRRPGGAPSPSRAGPSRVRPVRRDGSRHGVDHRIERHAVKDDPSSGGSADTGMEGTPSPTAGPIWRARGAPIPSAVDPGRAEQTRPMASRSFVQWRAPPGHHEPRPLHGVWVDGGRDGSWGEWWARSEVSAGPRSKASLSRIPNQPSRSSHGEDGGSSSNSVNKR
jgi:hypothetical protein